jgi:hypothetical protein
MRRWYYGWQILGVLAITETLSYGMLILTPLVYSWCALEQAFGWSRATITGAVTASQFIAGLLAWPVGVWLDRHGALLVDDGRGIVVRVVVWFVGISNSTMATRSGVAGTGCGDGGGIV